jgi:peroxiredoxin
VPTSTIARDSTRQTLSRRALLLTTGSFVACAPATLPPSSPSPLLGTPLPAFSGTTLNGVEFDSNASRGFVLTVAFFDSQRAASDRDLEMASDLYGDHHSDLVLVGVSLDASIDIARSQAERHSLRFPILFDPDRQVAMRLGVTRPGTILAVDRRGILRWVGEAKSSITVEQVAEALLAESG